MRAQCGRWGRGRGVLLRRGYGERVWACFFGRYAGAVWAMGRVWGVLLRRLNFGGRRIFFAAFRAKRYKSRYKRNILPLFLSEGGMIKARKEKQRELCKSFRYL